MVKILTYFFVSVIEIYSVHILFSPLSEKRLSKKLTLLLLGAAVLLDTVLSVFFANSGSMLIIWIILCCCIIGFIYKTKPLITVICSVAYCVVNAAAEMAIVMGFSYLLGSDSLDFLQNDYIYFGASLLCKFAVFIIIFFVSKKLSKVNPGLPGSLSFLFAIQPVTTIFVIIIVFECTYKVESLPPILFALTAFAMILANMVTIVLIYRQKEYMETKAELAVTNERLKNQTAHYEELYRCQNELRIFRHDIKNKLSAITGLLRYNKPEEALAALEKEYDFLNQSQNAVINTGNPALDGVLQSKLTLAKGKNIVLNLKTSIAEEIVIPPSELGVIVGNILDNAIEAAEKVNSPDKCVTAEIIGISGRVSVHTENKTDKTPDKAFLTTSKKDRTNHGYGLKSVKALAQKYDGDVFICVEDGIFKVSVNLLNTFAD